MMRFAWMVQAVLVLAAPAAIYAIVHRDRPRHAVRGAALVLAGTYVGVVGVFVVGETLADPGGWVALGMLSAWLVPTALLSLLAWHRPALARPVLLGLVVAVVGVFAWSVLDPEAWRAFEDDTGPVRGVVTLALVAPLGILARRQPREAGWLLLALGLAPLVAAGALVLRGGPRLPLSVAVIDAPVPVIAALLLASARFPTVPRVPGQGRGRVPGPPRRAH